MVPLHSGNKLNIVLTPVYTGEHSYCPTLLMSSKSAIGMAVCPIALLYYITLLKVNSFVEGLFLLELLSFPFPTLGFSTYDCYIHIL